MSFLYMYGLKVIRNFGANVVVMAAEWWRRLVSFFCLFARRGETRTQFLPVNRSNFHLRFSELSKGIMT